MADREGVLTTESVSQAGSDEEEEEEVKVLTCLMDRLRHKEKSGLYRSWQDATKSLKHSVTDKYTGGEFEDRNALQKELTSLTKMVKVNSVSSLVTQLEQCGKRVGLNLVTMSGANRVILKSDMFEVHVTMETTGKVKDVVISHEGISNNRDVQACEELSRRELAKLLCDNKFDDFTRHLEGLVAVFSIAGDRAQKLKAFNALQYLETDLNMLSKMQSTISSVANYIHKSPLGILQPRIGGVPMQMTYFVGPYDLLCPQSTSCCPMTVEAIVEKQIGNRVSVGIMPSSTHTLQTMPLIMDGKSIPSFSALNKMNSTSLPAVFVLRLHEQMPMSWSLIQKITKTTGVDFVDKKKLKSLMSLLIQHVRKKDLLDVANRHGLHVHLPDQHHSYFLHPWPGGTDLEGAMVTEIPFTHPTHVAVIINCLRQQVLFNTMIASCVRNATPHNGESCWTFELIHGSLTSLTVSFEHPYSDTIAAVEVDLSDVTAVKCHIMADTSTSETVLEPFCSDESATKVLQRCLSLPVTLRWILHQALAHLQQKIPSPSLAMESTPHSTYGSTLDLASRSSMSSIGQERRQAFIDAHSRSQLPWKHMNNNMMRLYSGPLAGISMCKESPQQAAITPSPTVIPIDISPPPPVTTQEAFEQFVPGVPMDVDDMDKVSRNPMLASLLGQDTKSPALASGVSGTGEISPLGGSGGGLNAPHQSMLSALLGDPGSPPVQQQQQYPSPQQQQIQQIQRQAHTQQNQHQQAAQPIHKLQQNPQETPLQQQLSTPTQAQSGSHFSPHQTHLQQQLSAQAPPIQQQAHQSPLHQQTLHSTQLQQGQMQQPHHPVHHPQQPSHQLPQHQPPHLSQFQQPTQSQASQYPLPFPPAAKKPRKRRSVSDRLGETTTGRAPKRKPSEDIALFNVDGSSSNSMDAMNVKLIGQCTSADLAFPSPSDTLTNITSATSCVPSSSPSASTACPSASMSGPRSSESHVNRLASTMDSIIKQETRTGVTQASSGVSQTLGSLLQKDGKRLKSENDTVLNSLDMMDTGDTGKTSRCYSESDGAFANSKLSLKTVIKTEKPDPFDFSASVPSSKDLTPDSAGGKVLKLEAKLDIQKDLSMKDKNDHEKPVVNFDKTVSLDSIKTESSSKYKERKKEKREPKESTSLDERALDKEKPPAITVKLNTRELTARTIIKESPVHNSSSQDGYENAWKDKVKEAKVRGAPNSEAGTIDLTADAESDKSSSSSTPSRGRVTPGSTPNASPRVLQASSLKRENKEKARGEKRRRSSKHNVEGEIEKKHKKHNEDARKEQLSKKQGIYDFDADNNETDNYRVEKMASKKLTTIKICTNKKSSLTSKNSPISPAGGRSPNLSKLTGVASPLKMIKVGDNSKVLSLSSKQRTSGTNVQRTYARSKSDIPGSSSSSGTSNANATEKVDTKLNKIATIKLKPLNMTSSATVTVTPTTSSGAKTTQSPSSAPVSMATKTNASASSTSGTSGGNSSASKAPKPVPKTKKLLAVIDKLKKQQTTSPSGLGDSRDSDNPSSKNQAIYDAIRLQIIREGNKPSTPTKDLLTTNLKSSHNKKESSSKSESFKKSDFSKSGAMPSVNTSLGTIPKTSSSQSVRQNSNSSNSATNPGGGTAKSNSSGSGSTGAPNNKQASHGPNTAHKAGPVSSEVNAKNSEAINNRKDAVTIIASKDPRTAAHINNKATISTAAAPNVLSKEVVPPNVPDKSQPPPNAVQSNKKSVKLDDISERLQKNPRHFLDAVKLPVNGSPGQGQGQSQGDSDKLAPASDLRVHGNGQEPDPQKPQHPNHEIFTENPSSPTDDPEADLNSAQNAHVASYVPGSDSRASPSVDPKPGTPVVNANRMSMSSGFVESVRTEDVGSHEPVRNTVDNPRKPNQSVGNSVSKEVKSDSNQRPWRNSDTPSSIENQDSKEHTTSLYSSTPASKPSILKNSTSTYSKAPVSTTNVMPNNITDSKRKLDSPTPGKTASSNKTCSQPMLSIPCSPVSSPEDGLIIDCQGSPKSSVSPGGALSSQRTHTPSPCTMRPIQSPALRDPSPSLHDKLSPQRRLTPTSVVASRGLNSRGSASSGSPAGYHNSPVDIDDDLMDEALML